MGVFLWSRGSSQGISVVARKKMKVSSSLPHWLPANEMDPWVLSTFKSFMLPVPQPSQAREVGSQFIVLRTGAGLLCLQLHAFYGTRNVV